MDHNYTKYRNLKQKDNILILGAFNGDFIREKAEEILLKNISIINTEPDIRLAKECLEYSQKHLPKHSAVFNIACFNKRGILSFINREASLLSGIEGINTQWTSNISYKSEVFSYTIQDLILWFNPTAIYCDIEGAELEVFENFNPFIFHASNLEHIAIASYHEREGVQTVEKLQPYFEQYSVWDVIRDIDESREAYRDNIVLHILKK